MPHHFALPFWVGLTLTITVCGGAFWKGDREQQLAAFSVVLSALVTLELRDQTWSGVQWGAFAADIGFLAVLIAIALRTRRYWPFPAASFQLLCVSTHLARIVDPTVPAWAYATAQVIFTHWALYALGFGTFNTWRRRRQLAKAGVPEAAATAARR